MRIINQSISLLFLNAFMLSSIQSQVKDNNPGPSNGLNVQCVNDLQIKNFSGEKAFKVVVSQTKLFNINLKGLDPTQTAPYKWELGNFPSGTFTWPLKKVDKLSDVSVIEINALNSFKMPQNNNDFGSTNGVVKLTDAINISKLSTDPTLNKKVQVFFEKDAPNPLNPSEPNWSYYWKQFVDKNNITKFNFVLNSEMIATCGSIQAIGCVHKFQTEVYYRQKASENTGWTENKGLHAFIEVLAHEDEHLQIVKEHWPNGYNESDDSDKDFYPDSWESTIGANYGFEVNRVCDQYKKFPGCSNVQDYQWLENPNNSAGFRYEETRCLGTQKTVNVKNKDLLDWSYDKEGKYQGKNWK